MATTTFPSPTTRTTCALIGHSDQGGRPDGVQIMVHRGYAYVGHIFSKGFSRHRRARPGEPEDGQLRRRAAQHLEPALPDLRRPAARRPQQGHVRAARARRREELLQGLGRPSRQAGSRPARNWSAGLAVYDISKPDEPKQIGFMPVEGTGLHRLWYVGGRWAYASALLDGFSDYILITIDMADPTKPALGRQILAARHERRRRRDDELADQERPLRLHHAIIHDDIAYCAWRDACLVVVDVKDQGQPEAHRPQELGAALRRRHAQRACRCPTAISSSSSTRRCSTIRRTGSSRSGCSTTR